MDRIISCIFFGPVSSGAYRRDRYLQIQLLLIPVGGLARKIGKWKVIWFSVGLSIVIEVLRLVSQREFCEFYYAVHNCIGAAIGIGILMVVQKIVGKIE